MSWFKLISIKYIINKVKANLIFYLYIHNQTDIFLISKILNLIFFLFFFLLFLRIFWSRMSERKADKGHTYSVIHLLSSVDKCLSAIYQLKPINGRLTTPFNLQSINNSQSFFHSIVTCQQISRCVSVVYRFPVKQLSIFKL